MSAGKIFGHTKAPHSYQMPWEWFKYYKVPNKISLPISGYNASRNYSFRSCPAYMKHLMRWMTPNNSPEEKNSRAESYIQQLSRIDIRLTYFTLFRSSTKMKLLNLSLKLNESKQANRKSLAKVWEMRDRLLNFILAVTERNLDAHRAVRLSVIVKLSGFTPLDALKP
jgi:hypothetical protein